MGFRIVYDLNNGQDRVVGPAVVRSLGEARALLIERLAIPAIENSRFAVLEQGDHRDKVVAKAKLHLDAIVKVFELPVGEHLPMQDGKFYYIEEAPDRD